VACQVRRLHLTLQVLFLVLQILSLALCRLRLLQEQAGVSFWVYKVFCSYHVEINKRHGCGNLIE